MPSPGPVFTIKGLAAERQRPLPLLPPLPPLPPPPHDMRSPGYGGRSRSPPRRRSPPQGPRIIDRYTSDPVHPREARRDSRDRNRDRDRDRDIEWDRDRRRGRSRSPPGYTTSRPPHREEDRHSSYRRVAQSSPRPQHLSTNGSSAASSDHPLPDRPQAPIVNSPVQSVPAPAPAKTSMSPLVITMAQATASVASPAMTARSINPKSHSPAATPVVTPVAAPDEVHRAVVATFGDIFKQFGEQAIDAALFKQKKMAAEKEKEKCLSEYLKNKENHAKYPSLEESQRRARERAEKQLKLLSDQVKTQNDSLASIAMSAASKIPAMLAQTSGVTYDDSMLRNRCEDLQKRCDDFHEQLQTQKKLFEDEKKSRELLEKKVLEHESISKTTKQTLVEAHARQSKFEIDTRSESARRATAIQDVNDRVAQLSRESVDLKQKLQDELSKRLVDLSDVKGELDKVRKESAESLAASANRITPLVDGIGKIDTVDRKVNGVQNSLADWTVSSFKYRAQLKSWKKDIESDIENTRELTRSVNNTLEQELAALKQDVTRLAPKSTTPSADISANPNLLQSIQVIKSDVTNLQDQMKNVDLTSLTKRVSACEQSAKTFVKHSTPNEAPTELVKLHESLASQKKELESLSNKVSIQQTNARNNITPSTANSSRLEQRLSKIETQLASGTHTSKASSPLPSNIVDTSGKFTQQFRTLENKLALLPSKDWVHKEVQDEVNTQQDAAAEIFVTRLAKVELQANKTERKVGSIETSLAALQGTLSPLPDQVEYLKRQIPPLGASSSAELGALVNTAVQEATDAIDKKHMKAVTAVQLGVQNELWKQNGVYSQIDSIGIACSNLDQRYNSILTTDLHKAIVDQITQDHFPEIQRISPLEKLIRATASQVSELEKAVKNIESPLTAISKSTESQSAVNSENRLHEVENAQTVFRTAIKGIDDKVKSIETTVANFKSHGLEMELFHNDIDTLNKKIAKLKTENNDKISELSHKVEKVEVDIQDLSADHLKKQTDVANKFAEYEINLRRGTTAAVTKAPPSHNSTDRKSVHTLNGPALKKRKIDNNGHLSHSPASSSFSKSNGTSRTSPISKKRHRRWPSQDLYGNDDDDEVAQPSLVDDASDGDD